LNPDRCLTAGFLLYIEEGPLSAQPFHCGSLLFLIIVGISKKLKFRRVIGIEHMLRMKKFSTSDTHFQMGIFIPILVVGFFIGFFKFFYSTANPQQNSVSWLTILLQNIYHFKLNQVERDQAMYYLNHRTASQIAR
jgi:hypothetical protein